MPSKSLPCSLRALGRLHLGNHAIRDPLLVCTSSTCKHIANRHSNASRRVFRVQWPPKPLCLCVKYCNSTPMPIRLRHPYPLNYEPLQRRQMSSLPSTASQRWSPCASHTILTTISIYPYVVTYYTERSSLRVMQPGRERQAPNGEAMSMGATGKFDLRRAQGELGLVTRRVLC